MTMLSAMTHSPSRTLRGDREAPARAVRSPERIAASGVTCTSARPDFGVRSTSSTRRRPPCFVRRAGRAPPGADAVTSTRSTCATPRHEPARSSSADGEGGAPGEPGRWRGARVACLPVAGAISRPDRSRARCRVVRRSHVAVGRGASDRTTRIRQFRALLGDGVDELLVVPLPYHVARRRVSLDVDRQSGRQGPGGRVLAVMPVPFRDWLLREGCNCGCAGRGVRVDGRQRPGDRPARCVMLAGNLSTRLSLERGRRGGARVRGP